MNDLDEIQACRRLTFYAYKSVQLKQDPELPTYLFKIAYRTSEYEDAIRNLWEEFKKDPSKKNAKKFADLLIAISDEGWRDYLLDILNVDELSIQQEELLKEKLEEHHGYIRTKLLPDLIKGIDEGIRNFDSLDYRVIFLYAGALWSFGMLATVMFDGLSLRDLADLFLFAGPNDANTCSGENGCEQHVGKIYTVAEILARNIIPGTFKCLTSCRHMLIPVMSPLGD